MEHLRRVSHVHSPLRIILISQLGKLRTRVMTRPCRGLSQRKGQVLDLKPSLRPGEYLQPKRANLEVWWVPGHTHRSKLTACALHCCSHWGRLCPRRPVEMPWRIRGCHSARGGAAGI